MIYALTDRQVAILTKVVTHIELEILILKIKDGLFSNDEIEEIIHILSDEFLMEGIEPDWEPNSYGLEIEDLIDIVNRPRLRRSKKWAR